MKCVNHLEKDSVAVCNHCGKSICADCLVEIKGENYCKECVTAKMNKEKKEERSPILAAIMSFVIGGLGQIYNGQIGKGILIFFTAWLIIPWIIGIVDAYKTAKKINEGLITVKSRPGCLIAVIAAVVIFWVGIFFVALLAAIAIPNFLRARMSANEAAVKAKLRTITTALEAYRAVEGKYPGSESELISAQPPYLPESYNNKVINGYIFTEDLRPKGYTLTAKPKECGETGHKIFIIKTDGVISEKDCKE